MKRYLDNIRGGALLASTIVSFLVLASVIAYTRWSHSKSKQNTHLVSEQRALLNADAGIHEAMDWLRKPQASLLQPGIPMHFSPLNPGATYQMTMLRQIVDTSLVNVWSTGTYHAPGAPAPNTASIFAQVKLESIAAYLVGTPGTLEITYGAQLQSGNIYGRDLIFDNGIGGATIIQGTPYYYGSFSPLNAATFVNFNGGPPVQLAQEPNIPVVGNLEADYIAMAGTDILTAGTTISGTIPAPSNAYRVYYCPGNLTLGTTTTPFAGSAEGNFLFYVAGDVTFNMSSQIMPVTARAAMLVKGNIFISESAPAAAIYIRRWALITDGRIQALGPPRYFNFHFDGSIMTHGGVQMGSVWQRERIYNYVAPSSTLPLPNITRLIVYKVLSGKFNQ